MVVFKPTPPIIIETSSGATLKCEPVPFTVESVESHVGVVDRTQVSLFIQKWKKRE